MSELCTLAASIDCDAHPDSYIMGWRAYCRGAVSLTNDPEIDVTLFREGWEAAKLRAGFGAALNSTIVT